MEHVGIDLGSSQSSICIVRGGEIVKQKTLSTHDLGAFLARQQPSVVVMESCAESRRVALMARESGHEVRVVPTSLVRTLGVSTRNIKTDRRDAMNLAVTSYRLGEHLPAIHIRSEQSAEALDLLRGRTNLVQMRTQSINYVRSQLRKELLGRPRCGAETISAVVGDLLDLTKPKYLAIKTHLAQIELLNGQIAELDAQVRQLAKREDAQRLQRIPGVGPIVSLSFIAVIDDPKRFESASRVGSYVGLSPGENTTGGKAPRRTGVIAAGQVQLRSLLVQAAHSAMRSRSGDPIVVWARELAAKRGRKLAACALARRLAVIMWAMLRTGATYDPSMNRPRHPRSTDTQHERGEHRSPSFVSPTEIAESPAIDATRRRGSATTSASKRSRRRAR